jgi:hypothetical protein
VGFVTQKSQLKIPSKHMEFQKSSSAGFLFFEGARHSFSRKSRSYIYLFRLVFFFSSYSALQLWLRLSLSLFSIFRFWVRSLFPSLFFFFFFSSHTHTHLLLNISLSKSGYYGAFLFLFPHYFNFFHHLFSDP